MRKKHCALLLLAAIILAGATTMALQFDGPDYSPEKHEVSFRPSLIHPSGTVFFLDTFGFPTLGWNLSGAGVYTVVLRTNVFFEGGSSVRIDTAATDETIGGIVKSFALLPKKKVGVEMRFNDATVTSGIVRMELEIFDGTDNHSGRIQYSFTDQKWQYYNSAAGWTDVPNGAQKLAAGNNIWHHTKLIYDYDQDKYVRLYSDGTTFDLSALSGYTVANTSNEELQAKIYCESSEDVAVVLYVDHVVLTEE